MIMKFLFLTSLGSRLLSYIPLYGELKTLFVLHLHVNFVQKFFFVHVKTADFLFKKIIFFNFRHTNGKKIRKGDRMSEITKCIVVNLGALIKFSDGGEGRLPTSYGRIRLNPDSLICIAGKVKRVEKTGPVLTLHVCPIDSYDVGYPYVVVVVSAFKAMLQWNVGDVVKIVGKEHEYKTYMK